MGTALSQEDAIVILVGKVIFATDLFAKQHV